MSELRCTEHGSAVRFDVRVRPRASRSEIAGTLNGALVVRLQAAPVDDAANDALIRLLAQSLGVRRSGVRIVAGHKARGKIVEVTGIGCGDLRRISS